ncbi:MAG: sulfite exporter TauE/SafE family protein, partial [Gammaproteobacteria bacterium]|nr:sulfite exporter TauE/SafE family protein [Gammaproteobacteria bacterium]
CVMDVLGLTVYWGKWDRRNLAILIPAALVGIAIGTATFRWLDADAIRIMIGALAVGFTGHQWLRALGARQRAHAADALRGTLWGTVCGFASFVAHAAGPPLSIYLLPQRLDKTLFVGTTVALVFLLNLVKIAPYAWIGQFTAVNLYTALVLAPLAPVGIWLGLWLHRRAPEALFYRVCYALLFVVGLRLLYDGFGGMLGAR